MYVLFEGIDRAGKSTQIELLQHTFPQAIFTKEPGGTSLGQKIRQIILHTQNPTPLAELFLFLADRAEHTQKVIRPNSNRLIISDRGFISGIAYAHIKTKISLQRLYWLNAIAMQHTMPDKIIFIKLNKEELKKRLSLQPLDNIEQRGLQYLLDVQEIMQNLIIHSKIAHLIIDGAKPIQEIHNKIVAFIKDS